MITFLCLYLVFGEDFASRTPQQLNNNHSTFDIPSSLSTSHPDLAYTGLDFPSNWPLPPLDDIHMPREDSVHYTFDKPLGVAEWKAMLPSGDGLLRLGQSGEVFSIGLFHQLRCLDIVREAVVDVFAHPEKATMEEDAQPPLVQHCMDFLREMVLCHADMTTLNVKVVHPGRGHVKDSDNTHQCKDFSALFAAAEENYAKHH